MSPFISSTAVGTFLLSVVSVQAQDECNDAWQWVLGLEEAGGWLTDILKFTCLLYLFVGLVMLCDSFYVSSLEAIGNRLQLKEDVVGASFMALGNAIPEISVALIAALSPNTVEIGPGAIIGSCMFNLLVTSSACCLVVAGPIVLSRTPILRELGSWLVVCATLIIFLRMSSEVSFLQALTLVLLYLTYICSLFWTGGAKEAPAASGVAAEQEEEAQPAKEDTPLVGDAAAMLFWALPSSPLERLGLPFHFMHKTLIPDCETKPKLLFMTFLSCIAFIGGYSRVIVFLVERLQCTLKIPSIVLSFLLVGLCTNVPDMIANMLVARKGMGAMSIASCLGSNVCTLSIGLGLPWTIATLAGYTILLSSDGIWYSVITLLCAAGLFLLTNIISGFVMHKWHAYVFLSTYVLVIGSATWLGISDVLDSSNNKHLIALVSLN